MTFYGAHQQQYPQYANVMQTPQAWGSPNPWMGQVYGQQTGGINGMDSGPGGLLQAAYGQPYGQWGGQQGFGGYGAGPFGLQQPWGQPQRQLSQQDVGEVVRQLVPLLPQVLAQAQQPQAAFGYGNYGQMGRLLTQQDVNEVVRQILPILPQIVSALQGQGPQQMAAMYGAHGGYGHGAHGLPGQFGTGQWQGPGQQGYLPQQFGQQQPFGQFGQFGMAAYQPAVGGLQSLMAQRQLSQHDINEVVRQLIGVIPQVIGNLQAFGQQRQMM